jgi:hypothetical protein
MRRCPTYGLILLALFCGFRSAIAQQADTTGEIIADPRLEILVEKHILINQALNTMDGFRIQIFSDSGINSKTKAQEALDDFKARFPEQGAYLSFKSPNYKVRIGDFRTKLDAQRFLIELTADYPNSFIIEDQINLPATD